MSDLLVKEAMDFADSIEARAGALTVGDVAALLNVSERQVYKLAAEHRVPCFRIGASVGPPGKRRR